MDGLWSSPDLVGLLTLAAATAAPSRSMAAGGDDPCSGRSPSPIGPAATRGPAPGATSGPLRPGQRPVPAVPRRVDDLLVGRVRAPTRPSPMPRQRSTVGWPTSPGWSPGCTSSRSAPGGAGSRCTRPGNAAAGSRRSRSRPSSTRWPRNASARPGWRIGWRSAWRLPRHDRPVRRGRLDRDAGGRRRRVLRDVLRAVDRALRPGGRFAPPGRSPSRTSPTSGSAAARTGSRPTSSRAACARHWPSSSGRSTGRGCSCARPTTSHRAMSGPWPPGASGSWRTGPPSGRWASTSASSGCGSTTSPCPRPGSRPA